MQLSASHKTVRGVLLVIFVVCISLLIWFLVGQKDTGAIIVGCVAFVVGGYFVYHYNNNKISINLRSMDVKKYVARYDPLISERFRELLNKINQKKGGNEEDTVDDMIDLIVDVFQGPVETIGDILSDTASAIGSGFVGLGTWMVNKIYNQSEEDVDTISHLPRQITSSYESAQLIAEPIKKVYIEADEYVVPYSSRLNSRSLINHDSPAVGHLFSIFTEIDEDSSLSHGDKTLLRNLTLMYLFPFKLKNVNQPFREYFALPTGNYQASVADIKHEIYNEISQKNKSNSQILGDAIDMLLAGQIHTRDYGSITTTDDINACIHLLVIHALNVVPNIYECSKKHQSIILNQMLTELKNGSYMDSDLKMLKCYGECIKLLYKYLLSNALNEYRLSLTDEQKRQKDQEYETEIKFIESVKKTTQNEYHSVIDELAEKYYSSSSNQYIPTFMEKVSKECRMLIVKHAGVISYLATTYHCGYHDLHDSIVNYIDDLTQFIRIKPSLENKIFTGRIKKLFKKSDEISSVWTDFVYVDGAEDINDLMTNPSPSKYAMLYFKNKLTDQEKESLDLMISELLPESLYAEFE